MENQCDKKEFSFRGKEYYCSIELAMDLIGGKWKTKMIFHLRNGALRSSTLQRCLGNISNKMFTQTARELERDQIIERIIYPVIPPKVEYRLTRMGLSVLPIVLDIAKWGIRISETSPQGGGEQKDSGLMYHYRYPRPAITTDCVLFSFDGVRWNVLLIQRDRDPYRGYWAFPGGFLNMDETAEEGALRELCEETGLPNACVRQLHTFSAPDRDPRERVISVAYYALVRTQEVQGADDAAEARWFPLDQIPPLAFDHPAILDTAFEEVRRQVRLEPKCFRTQPEAFTDQELQLLLNL